MTVDIHGGDTRGQTIWDRSEINNHNVVIIGTLNKEEIKKAFIWIANA